MNPRDKNGNVLNIGDRVVYMKGTPDEDFGIITKFDNTYGDGDRVYSHWSSTDGCESQCGPENVELIEPSVTSNTFTPEDEALLQKLLAKKQQALHVKMQAEEDFDNLVMEIREYVKVNKTSEYLAENTDKICDTLQAYKQHCM